MLWFPDEHIVDSSLSIHPHIWRWLLESPTDARSVSSRLYLNVKEAAVWPFKIQHGGTSLTA